ncbi:sensor histidine kinase [Rhizobium tubonense]|uniref:histidine kinase n=1 Tax=Rhizobium tubonense TaxID=484088 RepID=A0A2W4CPA0_9HYPH|nr:sensor histidine kinase [Rhizobium tubonense]PZM14607.1 histidine kinase [Rhizobium tubonense]
MNRGRDREGRLRLPALRAAALALLVFANVSIAQAGSADHVPRILLLYPYDERIAATNIAGEAMRTELLQARAGKIDIFSEFLDLSRFPEQAHIARMAQYLAEKYAARTPDVIIALGEESARFIVDHRSAVAPAAKIIAAGFDSATAEKMGMPNDVIGAFTSFHIAKTAEMARRLQPDARHLFVIGGSSDFDRKWLAAAHADLEDFSKDYDTTYLEDMTIEELVARTARLPADSIVLALTVFKDRTGRNFIPREALKQIAATASAPIYGPYETYLDYGEVGGSTVTFASLGRTAADLAIELVDNKPVSSVETPQNFVADWRQLNRWGLKQANLPPGTLLMFKEPGLWEQHWLACLAAIAVVGVQAIVIAALLLERRRRHAAERRSRLHLLEVVHLNQSATAGALSSAVAHELNQPLGAIRINAEAVAIMLRSDKPDLALIEQILFDIQADDQRAGDIVSRMRGMLKKRNEIDWQEFDLNDVTSSALRILHGEAERRGVEVRSTQEPAELPVLADKVHLQQVILNLATNAMDAMLDNAAAEKIVMLATRLRRDKVEISVSDTGKGIPDERLASIFEPFYTTKPSGTGLGLSIARAIVEMYGGSISAGNCPEGGAIFRVLLPLRRKQVI